jgi:hypothetical protein
MRQNLKDMERCVSDWSETSGVVVAIRPEDEVD